MGQQDIQIELTLDGSNTLFVSSLNEHYHSVNGAIQESYHVFVNAGFLQSKKNSVNILEVGFGTGLNTYLTLLTAEKLQKKVNYTALELYPLDFDIVKKLNYPINDSYIHKHLFEKIHLCKWNDDIEITDMFRLTKIQTDFSQLNLSLEDKFDIIYFDAFSPDKQPEMWTQEIFDFLYNNTATDGILTTYCAKGLVRRMIQQAGYKVERLPGPPRKREMLRGVKLK